MNPVALHHVARGPVTGPPVVLGGSLGSTHRLWDELVVDLARDHRVVAIDHRGHGESPTARGDVSVADLAADVVALADRLGLGRFHYLGISLGGAVGLQLALDAPDRLESLTLACTAAWFGGPAPWRERAAAVRRDGMKPLREPTGQRWFTDAVRPTARAQLVLDELAANDPESYAACCGALADFDVRPRLGEISAPTRIIAADQDPVAPPEFIDELAPIPGADTVLIQDSAHLANLNQPDAFNRAVREQLTQPR